MPINDFKPFATAAGANVLSQDSYNVLAAVSTGWQGGVAKSTEVNKAMRQATFIAAAVAQYVADLSGQDVLDDGSITNFVAKLRAANGTQYLARANNLGEIRSAGTTAQLLAVSNLGLGAGLTGIIGQSRNAKMSVPSASSTATFTADEIVVGQALGAVQFRLGSFNKAINLGTTGAGGMDIGAVPANGFVAMYSIYNPSTGVSALLGVNATSSVAPEIYGGTNMPAGYTASALVSVWGTTESRFRIGFQSNRYISIPTVGIYSVNAGTTTQTQLSVAPIAPPNAISVDMSITAGETLAGTGVAMSLSSSPSGIGQFGSSAVVSGSTSSSGETGTLLLIETQRLYFSMSNTNAGSYSISCRGYDF